jgi:hypothetical protein
MAAFSQLRRAGENGPGSVQAIRGLVRRLFGLSGQWLGWISYRFVPTLNYLFDVMAAALARRRP